MRASNGTDGSSTVSPPRRTLTLCVVELLMPIATFRSLRTSSRKPSMLMIVSPSCKPPSSTELPSLMLATVVVIKPFSLGACTANSRMTKPMRKFISAPAATMRMRRRRRALPKACSLSLSPSSPSMTHAPPNGSSFRQYIVP